MLKWRRFKQVSKEEASHMVAAELCEHWIWCNVYLKNQVQVEKDVLALYEEFKNLKSTGLQRQTEKWKNREAAPMQWKAELRIWHRVKEQEVH